jgi:hypothetical protein
MSKFRPYIPYILSLVIILGGVFYGRYRHYRQLANITDIVFDNHSQPLYTNPLSGEPVSSTAETAVQVVGVMIDNHVDAWPQSGVAEAKIVYEAVVEGGITRYFALYDSTQNVAEVGPVRSARVYFLDWIQEYGDGLYVHSGGSPQALAAIKPRGVFDANEFFWGRYFWRASHHYAPHNLYISGAKWQAMLAQRQASTTLFTSDKAWKYTTGVGTTAPTNYNLAVTFSAGYEVEWQYNSSSLQYQRSINNKKEKDRDGSEIWARNLVVQVTDVADIANDDKGRQEVKTIGSGKAIVLKKGAVIYGTWSKKSITDRTRFYDNNGQEIVFTPGTTWVEVVDATMKVEVK